MLRELRLLSLLLLLLFSGSSLLAQNCAGTSTGAVPLNDLGTGSYMGFQGGLYPGGSNLMPPAHLQAGLARAQAVQPLNLMGNPSPLGHIVLLTIGMSNTTQESQHLLDRVALETALQPRLVVVDGAQAGQAATDIDTPNAPYWNTVQQRLAQQGLSPNQVQAVWLKEALRHPTAPFPTEAQNLQNSLRSIVQILHQKYPHLLLCYLSSRTYAGYATTLLNPEPHAYESGFAVKWLIGDQISGDPGLNFNPQVGPVLAPWLAFGPYLWADGTTPRSDGLTWLCCHFGPDGTHPSQAGREQVGQMLFHFFENHQTTRPWFLGPTAQPPAARVSPLGVGARGGLVVPQARVNSKPTLGNPQFRLELFDARPNSTAVLFVSPLPAHLNFDCYGIFVDPLHVILPAPGLPTIFPTNFMGHTAFTTPIPPDPALIGLHVFAQWLVLDPNGLAFPQIGGSSLSMAMRIRFGTP